MKFWQSKYNYKIRVSQQELIEISTEISLNYSPKIQLDYSELVLLPVDPFHLYVYWSIDEGHFPTAINNDSLILRVYWHSDISSNEIGKRQWIDFSVNSFQHRKKVLVPYDNAIYSAAIGKQDVERGFSIYAFSNVVHTPQGGVKSIQNDKCPVPTEIQKGLIPDKQVAHCNEEVKNDLINWREIEKPGQKQNQKNDILAHGLSATEVGCQSSIISIGSSNINCQETVRNAKI